MNLGTSTTRIGVALIVLGVTLTYISFHYEEAEAVTTEVVGTLSAAVVPAEGAGFETVDLDFSGVLGQPSSADLAGWKLITDDGFLYDLSKVELSSAESVRLCEEGASDPGCDYFWDGNGVFSDTAGVVRVVAPGGQEALRVEYTDPVVGKRYRNEVDGLYFADVYTQRDKLAVCEVSNKGDIQPKTNTMKNLVNNYSKELSAASSSDVVPAFVYDFGKGMEYYPGINWPEQRDLWEDGCR